jgi:PPP family 3-phenylpropionic acid transporter
MNKTSPQTPQAPPQARVFACSFFAYYAYVGMFAPFASLYFQESHMSGAQIGILMTLMQVTRIVGPNLWGYLAERAGQRLGVLRATGFAALLCLPVFWLGPNFLLFFWIMLLLNSFTSAQIPLSEAILLSEMRGDLSHYGRLRLWGSVGFVTSVMLGGLLLDHFGVRLFVPLAIGFMVAVCLLNLRLSEPKLAEPVPGTGAGWSLLLQKPVLAFFASTCLMVAAHASLYVYYSLYLETIGYSKAVIGAMWSLGVLAEIVFFYYQAPLFRRFGARRLMLVSLVIGVARFIMIGAGATSLWLLLLAQILHAATFGAHHSASVMVMQRWFSGPLQARGQAWYISISYGIGGSLGGLLMSLGWQRIGGPSVYYMAAAMVAAAFVAAQLSFRWQKA